MSPSDERTWGMVAHAGTLAATVLSGGTLGFICALVLYLVYKDRGPFVRHHTANALNVQILGAILVVGGIILTVTVIGAIIGIPMIVLGGLYVVIAHIIGAIKANSGEWWNPPMTPQFVKGAAPPAAARPLGRAAASSFRPRAGAARPCRPGAAPAG